jgi:hypothetical protein
MHQGEKEKKENQHAKTNREAVQIPVCFGTLEHAYCAREFVFIVLAFSTT